jgi:hypothetical protein
VGGALEMGADEWSEEWGREPCTREIYRKRDERQKMEGKVYGILRSGGRPLISQASGACVATPIR